MAEVLYGKPVAEAMDGRVLAAAGKLAKSGIAPTLATVRVGDDPGDIAYGRGIAKRAEKTGVAVMEKVFPADVSQEELAAAIAELNADDGVHGILMFRPLPKNLDEAALCESISPEKDVDGVTSVSAAGVFTGSGQGFSPCTAQACIEMLDHYGIGIEGRNAAVLGRSLVIGRPVSMFLLARNATVTVCSSRTKDAAGICRGADIVIAAIGKARAVGGDYFAPGQTVIDVGVNVGADGKMCGDVDFERACETAGAVSPVPGGLGAVTTSVLMSHVVAAAERTALRG